MREITPEPFKVFAFDELTEDAQRKAVETIAGKLGGGWWDQHNIDDVSDTIRWKLAHALGTPGVDNFGEGDFPGIPGVTLDGWDVERGQSLTLRGRLNRENAPTLPWTDEMEEVYLQPERDHTHVGIDSTYQEYVTEVRDMHDAVRDAMDAALKAGRVHAEYVGSEENAREWIEGNEPEFREDGSLYA